MNSRVIVRVDPNQKDTIELAGNRLVMANEYNSNYRERNPVVAEVVFGVHGLPPKTIIVCHHNHFSEGSPFFIEGGLFSIPYGATIFCTIDKDGWPKPACKNLIGKRVRKILAQGFELPSDNEKPQYYHDRVEILTGAYGYSDGELVFTQPFSDYQVCYTWNGEARNFIKIHTSDIIAVLA